MKGKSGKSHLSLRSKLGLPAFIFVLCLFCFLAGFFGSSLLSQDVDDERPRPRLLQSVSSGSEFDLMSPGENGDDSISLIPFQVLSWRPRALFFPKFATAEQCQSIVNMAKPKLKPSTLALRKGETEESTKGIRTSSGVFISASEDESGTLGVIEEKIARATMIPRMHGEAFNVLRYEIGQKYNSHYDAFNPSEYGPQRSQRVASFLLYLTDVGEGGETMFPFENGLNMDGSYDFRRCTGLKVKPRQGDGLLFYSVFPNGTIDPAVSVFDIFVHGLRLDVLFDRQGTSDFLDYVKLSQAVVRRCSLGSNDTYFEQNVETSLHGSCPVIKGQKWVATKWIRDLVQDD